MSPRTPMMQQYAAAKAEHPGVLMAIRIGDFYEFYGDDAVIAAGILEITLTGRDDGPGNRIAMAGVPYHSVEKYLARLLAAGQKVALCDQLEDPKQAKGIVKRGVTRVLTPGTLVEDSMLSGASNNFLGAICVQNGRAGLALLDPSTGDFLVTELDGEFEERLVQELARIRPSELLVSSDAEAYGTMARDSLRSTVTEVSTPSQDRATRLLLQTLHAANLAGFGCEDKPSAVVAAAMVVGYAEKNGLSLQHVESLSTYSVDQFMRLDPNTRRSLELTQNLADGTRRFTLLEVVDRTETSMGARLLKRWIEQPLLDIPSIQGRQNAVAHLVEQPRLRDDLRETLGSVADIERLVGRCATGNATPRDLVALKTSLLALPHLADPLRKLGLGRIQELREEIGDHHDLALLLDRALIPDPPMVLRDGGVIKEGYDPELDKLRSLARDGKSYIAGLEAVEKERSGISTLKVGFNSVFGYFIEIPKSQLAKVPEHYIRKQTTANAERYITAELKDHESLVLGAEEKATSLETDLFHRLRSRIIENSRSLLQTAKALAELDVLAGFAHLAAFEQYVRPEFVEEDRLEIRHGRHPVVERTAPNFVANDLHIEPPEEDGSGARCLIITGPNMAGKSTYLRQTALIVLLAQVGSFVPAVSCRLGVSDRIFARIGAKDELALGQSTFMVEMVESANILNHASSRSLVILDEVGRGTSTYDGLAIAWAMIEHLAGVCAKTLFATHYHQLNALEGQLPGIANYRVAVEEIGDEIVLTHRVLPGGTDRSYGVHVARMAGVPSSVLRRATEILEGLEEERSHPPVPVARREKLQLSLFEAEEPEVVRELQKVDVNRLTPLEALRLLDDWKRRYG